MIKYSKGLKNYVDIQGEQIKELTTEQLLTMLIKEIKELKKKVMSIVTDSKELEEPKDPQTCNVFHLNIRNSQ